MKKKFRQIMDKFFAEWGVPTAKAPSSGPKQSLELVLESEDGQRMLIGTLSVEPQRFVFMYGPEFKQSGMPVLPGFPDVDQTYESESLFPFFQVRIPPTNRDDVRRVLTEKAIRDDDVFEMLRVLGRRTAASPFTLVLPSPDLQAV